MNALHLLQRSRNILDMACWSVHVERTIVITEHCSSILSAGPVMKEDLVMGLMPELLLALDQLRRRNLVHFSIRPEHIGLCNGEFKLTHLMWVMPIPPSGRWEFGSAPLFLNPYGADPFSAPELHQTWSYATPKLQLYAVGATLEWLLTGQVSPHGQEESSRLSLVSSNALRTLIRTLKHEQNQRLEYATLVRLVRRWSAVNLLMGIH